MLLVCQESEERSCLVSLVLRGWMERKHEEGKEGIHKDSLPAMPWRLSTSTTTDYEMQEALKEREGQQEMEKKMKGEADLWIWSPKSRTDNPAWQTIRNKGRKKSQRKKMTPIPQENAFSRVPFMSSRQRDNFECQVNLKDWKDTFPLQTSLAVSLTNDGHKGGKNSRQGDFLQPKGGRFWLASTKKSESELAARVWHWH